jgi:hypothetical protein
VSVYLHIKAGIESECSLIYELFGNGNLIRPSTEVGQIWAIIGHGQVCCMTASVKDLFPASTGAAISRE